MRDMNHEDLERLVVYEIQHAETRGYEGAQAGPKTMISGWAHAVDTIMAAIKPLDDVAQAAQRCVNYCGHLCETSYRCDLRVALRALKTSEQNEVHHLRA